MKEAIVDPDIHVEIIDSAIPSPDADQVVIRVVCTSLNPKDFKLAEWIKLSMNQGDDISGTIHSVGSNITEFHPGDRVAAFHEYGTPHGSWAEYAVAWAYATFHIPKHTLFEDAATLPLAAMTAATSLYLPLSLPPPWSPTQTTLPLLIYGASSAVGSFAIQLAQLSNIHPIIAVAGAASAHVETLIDRTKGDTIVDYRQDSSSLVSEIQAVLARADVGKLSYALDCISEKAKNSYPNILKVLDPQGHIALVQNYDLDDIPAGVTHTRATVRWVHQDINTYAGVHSSPEAVYTCKGSQTGAREFGYIMFRFFGRALEKGWLKAHPWEVLEGGLKGIEAGLGRLKRGEVSGKKLVVRIGDTEGVDGGVGGKE